MKIVMSHSDIITIETKNEKIQIESDFSGNFMFKGDIKHKRIDSLIFEKQIEELEKKQKTQHDDKSVQESLNFLINYITNISEYIRLDKITVLHALEANRSYSFVNYYQKSNFPSIKTIVDLKTENSKLIEDNFKLKNEHKEEIIKWQKKLTEAQKLNIDKIEVETTIDYDININVNCPYCDVWQSIDLSSFEPDDNTFESNHECESCCKIFSVKAERG